MPALHSIHSTKKRTIVIILARLTIFLLVLPMICNGQEIGSTEELIVEKLGNPQLQKTEENKTIWVYSSGWKFVFEGGVVTSLTAPASFSPPVPEEPAAPSPEPSTTSNAKNETPVKINRAQEDLAVHEEAKGTSTIVDILFIATGLGYLIIIFCMIWILLLAYRESFPWFLAFLLLPFAQFVFVVKFWEETKRPVSYIFLVGVPLFACNLFIVTKYA
ncbi:hypothetical protein [Pelagicoccus sp. SDUM812003]|uniref:hypothetical protein n=1 Tax=Pelagicoccus sp. SDUM812003 TaxID=3041267 RepID=UPI00280D2EA0|nr:hypothetical protein [Pelagicoccus sp. SDUM812003]MDQ8205744.1 hypothetical protein [Pelagicoccus sp. SDUM812003]